MGGRGGGGVEEGDGGKKGGGDIAFAMQVDTSLKSTPFLCSDRCSRTLASRLGQPYLLFEV